MKQGTLHILDQSGHREMSYAIVDPETDTGSIPQEQANIEFDRLVREGWLGFGTTETGENVQLRRFDPTYPKHTLSPVPSGG